MTLAKVLFFNKLITHIITFFDRFEMCPRRLFSGGEKKTERPTDGNGRERKAN